MKKTILTLCSILAYFGSSIYGQFTPNYTENYNNQVEDWNIHFDSIRNQKLSEGDSVSKIKGLSAFTRWTTYWDMFMPPSGDFQQAFLTLEEYQQQLKKHHFSSYSESGNKSLSAPVNWQEIGPTKLSNIKRRYGGGIWGNPHINNNGSISFAGHCGMIDKLYQHPTEQNTIFASGGGTERAGGGLFVSYDGGFTWTVLGTDKLLNADVTTFEIAVYPTKEYLFIGLSSGAIYRSEDNGVNWIECGQYGTYQYPLSNQPQRPYSLPFREFNNWGWNTREENGNLRFVKKSINSSNHSRLVLARMDDIYYSNNSEDNLTISPPNLTSSIRWHKFNLTPIKNQITNLNSSTVKREYYFTDFESYTKNGQTHYVAHMEVKELKYINPSNINGGFEQVGNVRNFIIKSDDYGFIWTILDGATPNTSPSSFLGDTKYRRGNIEVLPNDPNFIYFAGTHINTGSGYYLFKFDLAQNIWINLSENSGFSSGVGAQANAFVIDENNDSDWWFYTNAYRRMKNSILTSGSSYGQIAHADIRDLLILNNSTILAATDGGIYRSKNDGLTFNVSSNGLNTAQPDRMAVAQQPPFYISSGFWHSGLQVYNPELDEWHHSSTSDGADGEIFFLNKEIFIKSNQFGATQAFKGYNSLQYLYNAKNGRKKGSENISGRAYLLNRIGGTAELQYTDDDFNTSPTALGEFYNFHGTDLFVIPNEPDKICIKTSENGENVLKFYSGMNQTTPNAVLYKTVTSTDVFGVSAPSEFEPQNIVFDPRKNGKYWMIVKGSEHWGAQFQGQKKIVEYDPVSDSFIDLTFPTDDELNGSNNSFPWWLYITDLELDRETGVLYIGTSKGVYYLDKDAQIWRNYSKNLPFLHAKLGIVHCTGELHVASINRGIWKSEMIRSESTPPLEWNITTNTTWNGRMNLFSTLVVESGVTLTVTGKIVVFGDQKIIVKPGGQLKLDGGTITSECGDMWQGIYVQGDRTKKQTNSNQGYVYMINQSKIEHAKNAITYDGYAKSGGIIRAINSSFVNNKRDIQFLSYHYHPSTSNPSYEANNRSYFSNCIFEVNDHYTGTSTFPNVTLWDVNGVHFNPNNTFIDNRTNYTGTRRVGINSIDASYIINSNIFINLDYGIKAHQTQVLPNGKYIKVDNSNFDCLRGVFFQGLDKSRVQNNTFITDNTNYTSGNSATPYGIYLEMCDHYEVEENTLTSNADINGGITAGILVANHHGDDTEIYKNNITGHTVGVEAIDQNKPVTFTGTNNAGLEIICNDFENSLADIFVANGGNNNVPIKGISRYQGNISGQLADNLFANNSPNIYTNYGNENENITYFHHPVSQNTRLYPNIHDASIVPSDHINGKTYIQNCPSSTVGTVGSISSVLSAKNIAVFNLSNTQSTYYSLIDGGETAKLELDVKETVDEEAYNQYMELMDKAGYLSEEVLMEVAKKEDGFTLAMIRNILVANPLSAKIKELDEVLDNRMNQLPQYMRNQIKLGKTTLSTKEFLELEVIQSKKELDAIIQDGIEITSIDSTILNPKSVLLDLLSNTGVFNYDLKRLKIYASDEDIDGMDNVKTVIDSYKLTEKQAKYVDEIYNFVNLKLTWKQKGYLINQLPQNEINSLIDLANKNTMISASAMGLLALNNQLDYQEPVYMPELSKSYNINIEEDLINPDEYLLIYPNPTADFISVRYSYLAPYNNLILAISDIQGKVVHKEVLTKYEDEIILLLKDYNNGNYIVTISADDKVIFSDKIIKK